jgi:hypothetical protein
MVSYAMAGGIFFIFIAVIGVFTLVYIGGCFIAAKEAHMFLERFKDKVRLNEISGISMEDLTDALGGHRIFWAGEDYESAKKRKGEGSPTSERSATTQQDASRGYGPALAPLTSLSSPDTPSRLLNRLAPPHAPSRPGCAAFLPSRRECSEPRHAHCRHSVLRRASALGD